VAVEELRERKVDLGAVVGHEVDPVYAGRENPHSGGSHTSASPSSCLMAIPLDPSGDDRTRL
jgi:hypothetical protein